MAVQNKFILFIYLFIFRTCQLANSVQSKTAVPRMFCRTERLKKLALTTAL